MKKLLYTTTAFVLCGGIVQANAACIATPTCSSLGYTSSSSCDGGLKCPFGNYWNCSFNEIKNEITEKITELEKQVVINQSQGEVCIVGSILYSDKTCYLNPQKGKTPIGVVIYVDGNGGGQAMSLESIDNGATYIWGTDDTDISTLPNYTSIAAAIDDYNSCGNTAKIIAAGDKNTYPAAWAAHEYSTEGTGAGDWCLPAAGILYHYQNNKDIIKEGFYRANGTSFEQTADIPGVANSSTEVWSSSEDNDYRAWIFSIHKEQGYGDPRLEYDLGYSYKDNDYEVRPVLEF